MLLNFKLNHILLINSFSEKLSFKDQQFDLIICHMFIEQVKEIELVLFEMKRVLTCDGIILISMPNYYALRIWRLLRREDIEFRAIKRKNLRGLINQAGLKLIMEKRFLLGLNILYIIKKND